MSLPAKKAEGRGGGASLLFIITTQQVARQKKNNLHRRIRRAFRFSTPFSCASEISRRTQRGSSSISRRAAALDVTRETRARGASPRSHASRTGEFPTRSKRLGARGSRPGAGSGPGLRRARESRPGLTSRVRFSGDSSGGLRRARGFRGAGRSRRDGVHRIALGVRSRPIRCALDFRFVRLDAGAARRGRAAVAERGPLASRPWHAIGR